MEEKVTKRFLFWFRLALLAWVCIANCILHIIEFEYNWLIFISNIMLFTLEGDMKENLITVELGALVGLILTALLLLGVINLSPIIGGLAGFMIPFIVVAFLLIVIHPYAPKVFNNVGFAYLICATINPEKFLANMGFHFIIFIVGSLIFNGVSVMLAKPIHKLAVNSVKKELAET